MEVLIMKNVINKVNVNKVRKFNIKLCVLLSTVAMVLCNAMTAFADNENGAPSGVGGSGTMSATADVAFWIVRIIIILVGGAPGLIKIVQGQSDENPRDRNAGIAALAVSGAAFAGTFLVRGLI